MTKSKPPPEKVLPHGYDGKMERMASAAGVRLQTAYAKGEVCEQAFNRLLRRCSVCGDKHACGQWLRDAHRQTEPVFPKCVNAKALKSVLKRQKRQGR